MRGQRERDNARDAAVATASEVDARPEPARELRDSLLLFAFTVVSLGGYVGIAFAAVRFLGSK